MPADANDASIRATLVQAVHAIGADILHIQDAAGTYGFERAIFLLPPRQSGKIVITVHEYGWGVVTPSRPRWWNGKNVGSVGWGSMGFADAK